MKLMRLTRTDFDGANESESTFFVNPQAVQTIGKPTPGTNVPKARSCIWFVSSEDGILRVDQSPEEVAAIWQDAMDDERTVGQITGTVYPRGFQPPATTGGNLDTTA